MLIDYSQSFQHKCSLNVRMRSSTLHKHLYIGELCWQCLKIFSFQNLPHGCKHLRFWMFFCKTVKHSSSVSKEVNNKICLDSDCMIVWYWYHHVPRCTGPPCQKTRWTKNRVHSKRKKVLCLTSKYGWIFWRKRGCLIPSFPLFPGDSKS